MLARRSAPARFLTLVLPLALSSACGSPESKATTAPANAPREVTLVAAETMALPRTINAVGTLAAEERAELSFKVPGRVRRLAVDLGSRVGVGDVLAELEAEDYRLRVERASAALEQARARLGLPARGENDDVNPETTATVKQAKAKLEEATAQLSRSRSLLEEGVLARSSFDVTESTFKIMESQYHDALEEVNNRRGILAERRSDLALAEQQLLDTTLRAPFSGAVQARRASLGEFVAAGAPVLTLVKLNPLRLRLDVPEREASAIKKGQYVTLAIEGVTVAVTGVVARTSPAYEEANRSLVVEAEIPNPKGDLKPGSFARARIEAEPGAPSVVVPLSSVVTFAGIEKVVMVKDGKAVEKSVVTARRTPEYVEISSGLKAGDRIVKDPGNLATGMPVAPKG